MGADNVPGLGAPGPDGLDDLASYDVGIGASNIVACCVLLAFLASIAIFTFTAGVTEPVSYVRISSFSLPLMVAGPSAADSQAMASSSWSRRLALMPVAPHSRA